MKFLPATLWKRDSNTGVFLGYLQIFYEHIFLENNSGGCSERTQEISVDHCVAKRCSGHLAQVCLYNIYCSFTSLTMPNVSSMATFKQLFSQDGNWLIWQNFLRTHTLINVKKISCSSELHSSLNRDFKWMSWQNQDKIKMREMKQKEKEKVLSRFSNPQRKCLILL